MTTPDESDGAFQLAYDEAKRAVVQQASALDALRSRAGTLLAAATLATSFLGGLALGDNPSRRQPLLVWLAVGVFIALVIMSILLLVPWPGWAFSVSARKIIGEYIEVDPPASLPMIQRDLALHLDNRVDGNQRRLNGLYWLFSAASILLGLEVFMWLVVLLRRK